MIYHGCPNLYTSGFRSPGVFVLKIFDLREVYSKQLHRQDSVGESYECQREVVRWFIILGLKCTSRGGVKRNDNVMSDIFKFKYVQAMPNIFKFKYVRAMSLVIMTPYWNTSKNSCPVRTSSTTHEFYVIMSYCVHNASSPPTAFAGTSTSTRGVPTSGCNNHGHFVFLRFCSIRPITLVVVIWVGSGPNWGCSSSEDSAPCYDASRAWSRETKLRCGSLSACNLHHRQLSHDQQPACEMVVTNDGKREESRTQ